MGQDDRLGLRGRFIRGGLAWLGIYELWSALLSGSLTALEEHSDTMELGVGMLVDAVSYEVVREERRGRTEV